MTTFASQDVSGDGWTCAMELKSVNGRYFDVRFRLPRWMGALEDRFRRKIQEKLLRGRVDFTLQYEGEGAAKAVFDVDIGLGRSYLDATKRLCQELPLEDNLNLYEVLTLLKDVITSKEQVQDLDVVWQHLEGPLEELLDMALTMAENEGARLEKDLQGRLNKIAHLVDAISKRSGEHLHEAQEALKDRLQAILADVSIDEARFAQEAALLADKLDITEEIVRSRSHIAQFKKYLAMNGTVGKRLDFLVQELFREVNTMASKSSDPEISHLVVEIKAELEKMREQIQNVV